jgi:hypothetical protein
MQYAEAAYGVEYLYAAEFIVCGTMLQSLQFSVFLQGYKLCMA